MNRRHQQPYCFAASSDFSDSENKKILFLHSFNVHVGKLQLSHVIVTCAIIKNRNFREHSHSTTSTVRSAIFTFATAIKLE